jgi:hypothetical protein
MKKSELIAKLEAIEGDPHVAIVDHIRNIKEDSGDGSAEGIYPNFDVELITEDNLPGPEDDESDPMPPWIALSFENTYIDEENT